MADGREASYREPYDQILPGIPPWLMQEYFRDIGGVEQPDGWFAGEGWRARVSDAEPFVLGSLRVGRVRLQLEGEPEALAAARRRLEPKLIRGGG